MGKSTSSCFKIITCARGETSDNDDLASPESKALSDKRRWSFRKISARHRVPSSTVISEPVSVSYNKESPEVTTNNFHSPKIFSVPEKALIQDTSNETPPLSSALVNSELTVPLVPDRNSSIIDHNLQESVAVIIQAVIRGYLARRELHKLRNVVKLQAAVRGHLVRRQAVGTLRCVQAIVKMQTLVRAQLARIFAEKFDEQEDEKLQMDMQSPALLGKRDSCMKPNKKYNSTEKLISNGFARQLLESTPKTKLIHINCDPSKSDSAWRWLERWMAVTSSEGQQQEQNLNEGYQGQEENSKLSDYEAANEDTFAALSVSSDSKLVPSESAVPTEDEADLTTINSGAFEFHAPASFPDNCFDSLAKDDQDESQLENEAIDMKQEKDTKTERVIEKTVSLSGQIPLRTDTASQLLLESISDKLESESNKAKHNKKASCEPLEAEGQEFVVGSRKPCNLAFAAAQSIFEELSSTSTLGRSINSSYQDATADSRLHSPHSQVDSGTKTNGLSFTENSFSHDPRVQVATSEWGTEISISSTLDSPDGSEAEGGEIVLEIGSLEKRNFDGSGGADVAFNLRNAEAKNPSFNSEVVQTKRLEECDGNLANSVAAAGAVQVEQLSAEPTATDMQTQAENLIDLQINRSSPERTPRSHTTASELHGTPSSQISVNAKKNKKDSNMSTGKQKSQIVKRSPSNLNNNSGGRNSMEHLQKDSKNAKRRNSSGMAKPDHVDHEPRTSTSNPLPSYMQATESARAKAHACISPKSSPDVHDKDNHMKKRHSLPIANAKQGSSPRMQRSTSQAQKNSKGNGTHSPHNSAERRWQR